MTRFSLGQSTMRAAAALCASLVAVLVSTDVAYAHDPSPGEHAVRYYGCGYYSNTGKWSVASNVTWMWRTPGYPQAVMTTGGSVVDPYAGGAVTGNYGSMSGYTSQWLYYQVVVGTQRTDGTWRWDYGNWIARQDYLGEATDGLSTYVQQPDGSWVTSNYSNVGHVEGEHWIGYPSDLSLVTRSVNVVPRGRKYIYGHLIWGPIFNQAGQRVFAQTEHWEPLGYTDCRDFFS